MSDVLRFGSTLVLAEIEGTYGTDPTPTAADAIVAHNVTARPLADSVVREGELGYFGAKAQLLSNRRFEITMDVELASVGVANLGLASAIGKLLRAAGLGETLTASTRSDYSPVSSSFESATLYIWRNDQRYVALGARGSARIEMSINNYPIIRFTFTALFAVPTNVTQITGTFAQNAPVLVDTDSWSVSFDAFACNATALSIDLGQSANIYEGSEERCVAITGRSMTGELTIFAPTITAKDYFTEAANHAANVLDVAVGTASGAIVEVDAPAVQSGFPEDVAINDAHGLRIPLVFQPSSGNDELTLGFL